MWDFPGKMAFNLKKSLKENNTVLVVVPNNSYTKAETAIAKALAQEKGGVCYTTLNKMVSSISAGLKKAKVSDSSFFFIDAVTKTVENKPPELTNGTYVQGPSALTQLCLAVNKTMKAKGIDILFFDSISTLLIYHQPNTVLKTMQSIINHVQELNKKAIFVALKEDLEKGMLKEIGMFVDEVVNY